MPEGDTIFRTAQTLHRTLAGKTVTHFASMFPRLTRVHDDTPVTGRTVDVVTAAGKHLLKIAKQGGDARLTYWCPTCQS